MKKEQKRKRCEAWREVKLYVRGRNKRRKEATKKEASRDERNNGDEKRTSV